MRQTKQKFGGGSLTTESLREKLHNPHPDWVNLREMIFRYIGSDRLQDPELAKLWNEAETAFEAVCAYLGNDSFGEC